MREEAQWELQAISKDAISRRGPGASFAPCWPIKGAQPGRPHLTPRQPYHHSRDRGLHHPLWDPNSRASSRKTEHGPEDVASVLAAAKLGPPRGFQPSPPALHGDKK